MAEVMSIDEKEKAIQTSVGTIHYDYLVLGMGATTNFFDNDIYLVNSGDRLLKAMDKKSSATAEKELVRKGVHVRKGWRVTDYDSRVVRMKNGETIESANVIWVSGVKANTIAGLPDEAVGHAGRLVTHSWPKWHCNRPRTWRGISFGKSMVRTCVPLSTRILAPWRP